MADNEAPPIVVSDNAATTDPIKLVLANAVVIVGAAGSLAGFVSNRDLAGFIVWMKTSDGATFASAVMALAGVVYATWKSHHRATQVVAVAAEPRVPDAIITTASKAAMSSSSAPGAAQ